MKWQKVAKMTPKQKGLVVNKLEAQGYTLIKDYAYMAYTTDATKARVAVVRCTACREISILPILQLPGGACPNCGAGPKQKGDDK